MFTYQDNPFRANRSRLWEMSKVHIGHNMKLDMRISTENSVSVLSISVGQ